MQDPPRRRDYKKGLGSYDAARKTSRAYDHDPKVVCPKMAQGMVATDPNNAQLKAMFRSIKFSSDAAMELVTG